MTYIHSYCIHIKYENMYSRCCISVTSSNKQFSLIVQATLFGGKTESESIQNECPVLLLVREMMAKSAKIRPI